jgi:hypothetical protein
MAFFMSFSMAEILGAPDTAAQAMISGVTV